MMNKKVTSNEEKVTNNKQKAMCKYEKVVFVVLLLINQKVRRAENFCGSHEMF